MKISKSICKKVVVISRINLINILLIMLIFLLPACKNRSKGKTDEELRQQAIKICENNIIIDSHIDWPEWILAYPEDISDKTQKGDFDLERANQGGLNGALSVIYINSDYNVEDGRKMVDSMLNLINFYPKKYPEKFGMARNPGEIEDNFRKKLFSLPVCLENGSPVGNDIEFLKYLKKAGIVYVTLCHNKTNQISDSNYDTIRTWNGLSPFGIEVINEMNKLGIIVDISHSTDSTVLQALRYSKAPIIASHSSCRYFVPGYERNLSDTLIKAIARKNGVVMINFGSMFLDSICKRNTDDAVKWLSINKIDIYSKEGDEFLKEYVKTHKVFSDSKRIVDHIDHIVKIAGIDYVGIGSDFDGIGPTQPSDVPDVSGYPVVVSELLKRGYSEKDINKILSRNFLRVWKDVIEIGVTLNAGSGN
jgi:membrane dipeptidase